MRDPLTTSRRRLRRRSGVWVSVVSLGAVAVLGACTSSPDAGSAPSAPAAATESTASTASTGSASPGDTAGTAAAAGLLRARAAAVVAGDEQAYAATVADGTLTAGRHQLDSFAAARALRVSRLEVAGPVVTVDRSDPRRARAEVEVRYRVDDLDRADRVARLEFVLVRSGASWLVVSERALGPGAGVPWVAMPTLRVRRGVHGVVAGTVPVARLDEHLAVVDRAVPALHEQWGGTPARVLVLAPSTMAQADALLGRPAGSGTAPVAATTEGPTGAAGTATGDRVVLDPDAFDRLTASGRDVVLTHELAHVAVRASVPGRPAAWLAEGYADHLGYERADVSTARLVAPLVSAIRAGQGPRRLPSPSELQPAGGDLEVPYLAAWQAVDLIARTHGEAALRRLVSAGSSTGSEADAEAATDAALVSELGTTRAELTEQWLTRLADLAR